MITNLYTESLAGSQANQHERVVILTICGIILGINIIFMPFANAHFTKIIATVPFQSAIIIITDTLTATLLLIQGSELRQRSTLFLAGSYIFCSTTALAQFLTFPDTFPSNVTIAQVSPWLWIVWHYGFPLSVLGYLWAETHPGAQPIKHFGRAVTLTILGVTLSVGALTLALIWGKDFLPVHYLAGDQHLTPSSWRLWILNINIGIMMVVAASLMFSRSRWNRINLYLLLSLTALTCEVLCVTAIESRYTLYWFFARFDSVFASSTVLVMFLVANARLYRDLAEANRTLERGVAERTAQLSAARDDRDYAFQRQWATEAALRESEDRFRAAQEASLDGFTIYEPIRDNQGRVQDLRVAYANPTAARYCLSTPDAMKGRPISEVVPGTKVSGGMIERHASVLDSGKPLEYVLDYNSDGIQGHFLNMVVPFDQYLAATFRDITDMVKHRQELQAAKLAAEEANAAKSRFLASVSHDLRQPIMAQRLLLHTARSRVESQVQADILAHIGEALDSTDTMLARLMDFAALELGKVQIHREVFRLDVHLRTIVQECYGMADAKDVLLRLWSLPCWTESDPVLLGRILRNLTVNALRYTDQGSVLVAIRRRGDRHLIEVRDSGKGISPDQQHLIFEEFHQLDNQERNLSKGQGLGLAIVARTADLLGHRLTLSLTLSHYYT